jgi:teichuronic acid biosynthesis glycosyltransferase TuaG
MNEALENTNIPEVSVIMPAYNCERYIEEAVRSVMAQTVRDWELIVLDDGSADSTCDVVRRLMEEDPRITLHQNPENMGVAKTRNKGLAMSRGKYVALLDSDDVWYPEKLEKQLALAFQTGADVIYCSYGIIDETGAKRCDDFIVPSATTYEDTLVQSVISCSTALLSREVCDRYAFLPACYHEDLLLWLQILRDGNEARGVTEVLADYRVLQGSRSFNKWNSAVQRWKIYREYMKEPFLKSIIRISQYALLALKKYKKV